MSSRVAWWVGCVAGIVVFEIGAWLTASDAAHRHVWADAAWITVDVLAFVSCLQTARRAQPSVRVAWWCFTVAMAFWCAAMLAWAYYELVRGRMTPFPSVTDVLGWIGMPFFIAGILSYRTRDRSRVLGLLQVADLALTIAAIVALTVSVLYVPAIDARYPTTYVASALATPIMGVTTFAFGMLTVWQHIDGPRRRVLIVLLAGVFLLAGVSVLYAEALLAGRYYPGTWIDGLWVIGFLAIATAAREERWLGSEQTAAPERPARYAAIVPTAALVIWMIAWLGSRDEVIVINAVTGAVLAIALYLRIWTTSRLERSLAARVAREETRTWQLEARLARAHRLEAVGTLAGGVAHDFNNVLAAATAALKLARRKLQRGEQVTRDLDDVESVLWRAADLTSRLLDLARKREPNPVAVNPRDALERVRVLLDKVLPSNVALAIEHTPGVRAALVDPTGLEHALLNLGLNARDALRAAGGMIVIGARVDTVRGIAGDAVVFTVTDDGPGIPADVVSRVFEPFFTTKSEEGTGLGLAMVEKLATDHGGLVSVTSAPGRTMFRVALPAAEVTAAEAPVPAPHATVLVVSREDAMALATAGALERGGIAAVVARDAGVAVAESSRLGRIDAIVIDGATGAAGLDTMRALRNAGVRASSVLLLAPGGDETGEWAAVVRKPYDPRTLVEEVERAIARRVDGPEVQV